MRQRKFVTRLTGSAAGTDPRMAAFRLDSADYRDSWSYAGVAEADNARLTLRLTCSNTGAGRSVLVPVSLTVVNAAGTRDTITKPVTVTKRNACGFAG